VLTCYLSYTEYRQVEDIRVLFCGALIIYCAFPLSRLHSPLTLNHSLAGHSPVPWCCSSYCSSFHPRLGTRICRRKHRWPLGGHGPPHRRIRKVPRSATESFSGRQHRRNILLDIAEHSDLHSSPGCSSSICILASCYGDVSVPNHLRHKNLHSLFRVIPISIVGAHRFYDTITNFLGLIGYWASAFIAIIILEHLVIRHNNPAEYDLHDWDAPRRLPSGIAALAAGIASFGLVIPCMSQVWFTGPIAKTTGDIGFEVAFGVSAVLYLPFRFLEIRILGHV
jgi:hypothetical protein